MLSKRKRTVSFESNPLNPGEYTSDENVSLSEIDGEDSNTIASGIYSSDGSDMAYYILRLAKHRIAQIISRPLITFYLVMNIYSYSYMLNYI